MKQSRPFRMEGKNAVVTGGAMGIGLGIATALVDAGANVLIVDVDGDAAREAASGLEGYGTNVSFMEIDLTEAGAGQEVVARCVGELGSIDLLVNNAGIYPQVPMLEMTPEVFDRVYSLNLKSLAFTSKAAAAAMIADGNGGSIVNIGSIDSFHPSMVGLAAYDASKGGVMMFTKNFALELAPHGIRVNMVAPGGITTPGVSKPLQGSGMSPEQLEEMLATFTALIPMKRFGEPEEIGTTVVFLASEAASYITGTSVVVDGGRLLG
ncbi:MAG TPA: SDR family oxidoreductase [Actinomycetota bacterium]|nr:SDR family oxidoreductase [Actinomycetota bacterium]